MKKTIVAFLISFVAFGAMAADAITIKFSHINPASSPKGQGAEKFKELAEKYTGGLVHIDIGHASSMADDKSEMSKLKSGDIQMIAPSLSKLGAFYANQNDNPWVVIDYPFLFKSTSDLDKIEKAGIFNEMKKTMVEAKAYGTVLTIWDNGFKQLSTNKKISKYSDLADLKPRIQPSNILNEQWINWGAYPRIVAYDDLYAATFYGAVDSSENTYTNFYSSKLMPTQKYVYNTSHGYLGYAVIVNTAFWNKIPSELQSKIIKAFDDSNVYQNEAAERDNFFAMEKIRADGRTRVVDIDPNILAQMKADSANVAKVLSPRQKEFYSKIKKLFKTSPAIATPAPVVDKQIPG